MINDSQLLTETSKHRIVYMCMYNNSKMCSVRLSMIILFISNGFRGTKYVS